MLNRLRLHRRALVVGGGLLLGLVAFLAVVAVAVRLTSPQSGNSRGAVRSSVAPASSTTPTGAPTPNAPAAQASDVARWDAMPPIEAGVSTQYPAIPTAAAQDPNSFTQAFVTELFNRDYRGATRDQLLAWAQYEDAALRSPNYPQIDWTKVLVDSLSDLTWDSATDTPIPAEGAWLAQRSELVSQTVSNMKIVLDTQWEAQIAAGYQPPDPLATVRDVTATITQRSTVGATVTTTTYSVALDVQLGTSVRGDYGAAATNNYVISRVG
jgi:hypothetical protein